MPNQRSTTNKRRTVCIEDALWESAKVKADEREENISDVLRKALERYVKRK